MWLYSKQKKEKIYKLRKLYRLKQAPRAWYSRIETYFIMEGFQKCHYEHTLLVKLNKEGSILIVNLYVNDVLSQEMVS